VFDVDRVAIYRQQLGTLAIDENPFLSTAALRTLLSVGKTDRQLLKDILSAKVNPMRKAVAAYMMMRFGDGETVDFVSTEIVEYLSSAGSFHDARGLLLSVFAAKDAELGHSREAAREATATVEAKVWDPALTVEERLYFEDVLRLAKPPPIDD
jgi:hypothetical protein